MPERLHVAGEDLAAWAARRPRGRDADLAAASVLRRHGWTYYRMAAALGVHWVTVYRWLNPEYAERGRRQRHV